MTNQDAICKALLRRGYVEERRAGRYRKFRFAAIGTHTNISKYRYVLVGANGGLRVTNGAIANSHSRTEDPIHAQLIAEGQQSVTTLIQI